MRPASITRRLALVALVPLLGGCMSTILINTKPQGAQVMVDGAYLGRSPVRYADSAAVGSTHLVELHLQGYQTQRAVFRRDGPLNAGAACAGLLCLVPFAWVQDYPPEVTYLLQPTSGPSPGTVPPPYPGWTPPVAPSSSAVPAPTPGAKQPPAQAKPPPRPDGLPPPPLPSGGSPDDSPVEPAPLPGGSSVR